MLKNEIYMIAKPEHERLFDEICNKLNELSHKSLPHQDVEADAGVRQQMLEKMQGQLRRFQTDLQGAQDELRDKLKNLESVQVQQNDLTEQLKTLSEQLNQERATNTKLNTDLAKSLELSLQLQLEIQGLKARSQQAQIEEKKYSQSLLEKLKALENEYELSLALKDEIETELEKAKSSFQEKEEEWEKERQELKNQIEDVTQQKESFSQLITQMNIQIEEKNQQIKSLNEEIEKMSATFEELENSALKQNEVLKSLMETAEGKIVEMKLALDRKTLECQDYYSHLQQSLTQCSLLKSENANLKEHIEKINQYIQQSQPAPTNEAAR